MKTTVEIRDLLMAEVKEVCKKHNISMNTLIDRALEAEIEKLAAQPVWQPTDEFLWHGPVDPNYDADESIDQMYLDMMKNNFMSVPEEQRKDLHENSCWCERPLGSQCGLQRKWWRVTSMVSALGHKRNHRYE